MSDASFVWQSSRTVLNPVLYSIVPQLLCQFLRRNTNKAFAKVIVEMVSREAGYGLEVPYIVCLNGPKAYIDRMKELIEDLFADNCLKNTNFQYLARTHAHAHTMCSFGRSFCLSIHRGHFVWPLVFMGCEVCSLFRGCPYLGGRNVLNACYDQLGAGTLSIMQRLFASQKCPLLVRDRVTLALIACLRCDHFFKTLM